MDNIGSGLAWLGFWLFLAIGICTININITHIEPKTAVEDIVNEVFISEEGELK